MNFANVLTSSRFILTAGFIYALTRDRVAGVVMAIIFFVLATATDYCDGYVARKYGLITRFGKIMDPIADKFLILSAFILFWRMDIVAGWMVGVIAAREIGVTAVRFWALAQGKVMAAERAGKMKTVFQIAAIVVILLFVLATALTILSDSGRQTWNTIVMLLMWGTVGATLASGASFVWNNRRCLIGE